MKKLFTLLTMLVLGISGMWGQYLDRTGWSALASSACDDGSTGQVAAILDGSTTTWWHSNYGGSHSYGTSKGGCPHAFQLDLGSEKSFYGVQIQNRTDNPGNGRVKGYEIYVSNEPFTSSTTGFDASTVKSGKTPALTGTFSDSSKGAINLAIGTTLLTGRYVLFVITSSYNEDGNTEFAAIAEVNLLSVYVPSGYNSYTGENKAITSDLWKTQSNWVHKDNWDSDGPGCPNSDMWSPIYLKDITGGTVPTLEGWTFRMTADNSIYEIENVGKIQPECYLTLKNTSVVTMNFGNGHTYSFTVNLDEGTGNTLNFKMSNGYNHFNAQTCSEECNGQITVNYGSVSKNTGREFNASGSGSINKLILNATLTEPTEKNTVESIPLATFTNTTVTTLTPTISSTAGWTLVDSKAALETQTTNGKYYYVEQNSTSGVTLHTYLRSIYEVSASTTEKLSEITDYETYGQFVVPSGSTLNVDVAGFDLSKIGGAGTINVYEETVAQVTTAKTQTSNITGTINYFVTGAQTSAIATSSDNITYTGGAGTSESRVSITHNGGSVKLIGTDKTYYLNQSFSQTQTTVNMDGTTVNYSGAMGIGTATYNINNTSITTPRFITSQGGAGRPAVVNLTGNTQITVSGYSHDDNLKDSNKNAIMIGHWNGSSNVTLDNTAKIEAVDDQLLIGKTGNNQTITLNDNSSITAKGIKVSSGASGTNTLNLNGGSLNLGDVGITAYANSIAVKVNENATITAIAATLPISQPITVASGKTLTINGGESHAAVALTSSLTNNGTIILDGAAIGGSERINTSSGTFNIKNLAGNNLTYGTNNYVIATNKAANLILEGNCDFTHQSNGTETALCNIAIGNTSGSLTVKSDANVSCGKIYWGDDKTNAPITVESGATLESSDAINASTITNNGTVTATGRLYANTITNNGTITALKLQGVTTLGEGSTTTLSDATPFADGAVTVSGDATLNLIASTATLNQAITIAAGKTLTIDGGLNNVNITGNITGTDGTLNIKINEDNIITKLNREESCTLVTVSGNYNVGSLKINNNEYVTVGDYDYYISKDGNNIILSKRYYTRNVTSGKFGSICIENAALVSQMTGIEKVLKVTSVETDRVVMDEVEEMTAGVPYIFKSNADAINLTLKGENADEPVDDPEDYLVGNFSPVTVPTSDQNTSYYVLQSNKFKKVTSASSITSGSNRCYLKVPATSQSRLSTLGISVDEDGATGIDALNALINNNAEIYDINGRKLKDLRRGINIVNGVKVIVK